MSRPFLLLGRRRLLAQESVDHNAQIGTPDRHQQEPEDQNTRPDPVGEHQAEDCRKDRHQPAIGLEAAKGETQLFERELVVLLARFPRLGLSSRQRPVSAKKTPARICPKRG